MARELVVTFVAIGAFYVISAALVIRMTLATFFLDKALYSLSESPTPFCVRHQSEYVLSGAWLVGMSGMLTFFRIDAAVWFWCSAAIHQAAFLFFLAPYKIDPFEPPEPEDRRKTRHAFWLFCVFGGLVFWAYTSGTLRPFYALSVSEKFCFFIGCASLTTMALWWLLPSLKRFSFRKNEQ